MTDTSTSTYETLIALLHRHEASYELIDHEPVGVTEVVSKLRGHPLAHAAKCMLLLVKLDRRTRKYVLAVIPGDRSVDLDAIKTLYGARYAGFCDPTTAEQLAQAVPGSVLPFPMDPAVELVADPAVLRQPSLYFNAARLDRSIALDADDYARIARPRIYEIAK
ncbi:YbaK/EbsC family protein [Nocardia blacklockiae]|uniref:YbaK/EbsC family protein n=1 Tax=Nocardia blacklockiae TaxID=480036 RepID=UPI001895D6FB|nr:YbaK/EbsC family protein [Nocardia blacklockiae]MBF6171019.1 YbaK/prolyl-tRNA synthetase associated domain-containing protein [Nocardia blacklockiae]